MTNLPFVLTVVPRQLMKRKNKDKNILSILHLSIIILSQSITEAQIEFKLQVIANCQVKLFIWHYNEAVLN